MTIAKPTHAADVLGRWTSARRRARSRSPNWIPYLYGEPLSAHISRSLELRGREAKAAGTPTSAAATQSAAPSGRPTPPHPPTRPTPPGVAASTLRLWLDLGNGETNDEPVDVAAAAHLLLSKGLKPDTLACVDGTNEWKPASAFGINLPY
jgi:hypothetical protein